MARKALVAGAAAAALAGHGFGEARRYRVGAYRVEVLPAGSKPIRMLQVSDLHLNLSNIQMVRFMESVHEQTFDLVLATGDLLGEPESAGEVVRLLNGLKALSGKFFVMGSSDYYAPQLKNYSDYWTGKKRRKTRPNSTRQLREGLASGGWTELTNTTSHLDLANLTFQLTGLDDPYLGRDDRTQLKRQDGVDLAICVVHDPAPYLDALNAGYDLVVAGHTHGGQVRLPFAGALVTNSTLPVRLARGLSDVDGGKLFVTPGLGVAKFAPFRFNCPPEASILTLVPKAGR